MARFHTDTHYRWPLALRFIKGAIHGAIYLPVLLHAAFTALIVALDHDVSDLGLPSSIVRNHACPIHRTSEVDLRFQIPSLSIVVGLMLVGTTLFLKICHIPFSDVDGIPRSSVIKPPTIASGTAATISPS